MLARLHILPNPSSKLALNSTLKASLRQAITGGCVVTVCLCGMHGVNVFNILRGTSGSFGVPADEDDKKPSLTVDALDRYALERWEVV